jgi:Tol biopolymer transport system component
MLQESWLRHFELRWILSPGATAFSFWWDNLNMTTKHNAWLVLIVFLAGCAVPTGGGDASRQPTATSVPTFTPLPPTSTSTAQPSAVPSPSPISNFVKRCLVVPEKDVSLESIATGVVGLGDILTPPYLLDLVSQTIHILPYQTKSGTVDQYSHGIKTSPNRNNLAYMEVFRDANGDPQYFKIRVVDAKGNILAQSTVNKKDIRYWRWMNDDTIQISADSTIQNGTVALYSPFKKEWKELTNNFPGLYQDNFVRPSRYMVDYSPNLDWVIYLARQDTGFGPIVLDLNTHQEIWETVSGGATEYRPLWSPVGDQIAIVVEGHPYRLYVINRNGQISFPQGLMENDQIDDGKFEWSPDGHYIAFWVTRDAIGNLMLYDIQNDRTIDYCIQDVGQGSSIVWSPDSRQFITSIVRETQDIRTEIAILIDIRKNVEYQLSAKKPVVWMNSLP